MDINFVSLLNLIHHFKILSFNLPHLFLLFSPYPPRFVFNKPGIYLQKFSIIPTYIQNPAFRAGETKHFCPKSVGQLIKHKETLALVQC